LNDLLDNHSNLAQFWQEQRAQGRTSGEVDLVLRVTRNDEGVITYMTFSELAAPAPPQPIRIPIGPVDIVHEEDLLTDEQILDRANRDHPQYDPRWEAAYNQALSAWALDSIANNILFPLPSFGELPPPRQREILQRTREYYRIRRISGH
jgi:hypothetical protein